MKEQQEKGDEGLNHIQIHPRTNTQDPANISRPREVAERVLIRICKEKIGLRDFL
jgi:hypothetical protein